METVANTSDSSAVNSYTYDDAGNRTDLGLGDLNALNEYASLTYNDRGDLLDDGTHSFTYDAKDRVIGIVSDAPGTTLKEIFTYDAKDRVATQALSNYADGQWQPPAIQYNFIYDASDRIVEVAQGDNKVYTQFAWGPDGELAGVIRHFLGSSIAYAAVNDANGNVTELRRLDTARSITASSIPTATSSAATAGWTRCSSARSTSGGWCGMHTAGCIWARTASMTLQSAAGLRETRPRKPAAQSLPIDDDDPINKSDRSDWRRSTH